MTVNIWKLYMWIADKDVNLKAIFAVKNTTWDVVKVRPEKKFIQIEFFSGINDGLLRNFYDVFRSLRGVNRLPAS